MLRMRETVNAERKVKADGREKRRVQLQPRAHFSSR